MTRWRYAGPRGVDVFRRLSLTFLLCFGFARPVLAENPFGVMLWPSPSVSDISIALARAAGLGVAWFRPPAVYVGNWRAGRPCPDCRAFVHSPLKVALTVRNAPSANRPATPPADLEAYKKTLGSILDSWKPALLVVEYEENLSSFYAAAEPAKDYARQLTAACEVAHARSIPCTNGGLSYEATVLLVWLATVEHDGNERACEFARRTLYRKNDPEAGARFCARDGSARLDNKNSADRLADARTLLEVYKSVPIDAINFHWYGHDAAALSETADLLGRLTGKPVLSSEMGQRRWDGEPARVRPLLRAAFAAGMRTAIWFSLDTTDTVSLFNDDGTLSPAGVEFAKQMAGKR